jgi:hypothetical protein
MTTRLRRSSRICAHVLSLVMIGLTTEASAQGLAGVAKKEAERRKKTEAGKIYTNDDFPEARKPAPAAPAPIVTLAVKPEPPPPPALADMPDANNPPPQDRRDEAYWRARATEIRGRMEEIDVLSRTLKGRVADLTAQRERADNPSTGREQEVTLRALAKAQKDAQSMRGEWDRFEARARSMKVPSAWIDHLRS